MELLLNQGELLNLGKKLRGLNVLCHSGNCWLTQAGDSRDHILHNGQSVEIHSKGQILLYATSPCRLQLMREQAPVRISLVPIAVGQQ